jgi:hypothetical protein
VLSVLLFVKEQNKQILPLLNKKDVQPDSVSAVEELSVSLPLMNEEDLSVLQTHLKDKNNSNAICIKTLIFFISFLILVFQVSSYFSSFGGKGLVSRVNYILRHCLSNALASKYSFYGKRTKRNSATCF